MNHTTHQTFRQYLPGLLLLFVSIIIGLCTYKDYGISWDEPIQREMGLVSYDYAFKNDKKLLTYLEKDHGVAFEVPLIILENAMHPKTSRDIYLVRHLATHLFFLLCCFCGYVLVQHLFRNSILSSLAFLLLVFHPRIYAHSFFNSKDAPMMGVIIVSFLLAEMAFRKNKPLWYVLLGLVCGYVTSIRITGIVLLGPILVFFVVDIIDRLRLRQQAYRSVIGCMLFLFTFCLALYATFPTLWPAPVDNFLSVFDSLSHFRWDNNMLFMGEMVRSTELTAAYLPVWFCVTTPVIWLLAGFAGIMIIVVDFIRKPALFIHETPERNFILYLGCFIVPPLMIIAMHSVVYDDWRHLYFVYPAFVLLACYAFSKLKVTRLRHVVTILVVAQLADVGYFMLRYHPHHQVYFNQLVSHKEERLRMNYELDYWGSSYKQGLDYILAHDTSAKVRIFLSLPPVDNAVMLLPQEQKERIEYVDRNDFPYYFITGFRSHREDYMAPEVTDVYYEEKVLNSTILRVYRCK
jgi:hypothetical protein